jgi:hypothetical protein
MLKLCRFAVERVPTILVDAVVSVINNYSSRKIIILTRRLAAIQELDSFVIQRVTHLFLARCR